MYKRQLLYKGICPPSKPGRVGLPERDFCPLIPKPHEAPCPAAIPLPFLNFFFLEPEFDLSVFNVEVIIFKNRAVQVRSLSPLKQICVFLIVKELP